MKYEEIIKITEQALDLFPVKDFLIFSKEVNKIMQNIENEIVDNQSDYPELITFMEKYPTVFEDFDIFNYMADYEFIKYCEKRYPEIPWGHEHREIWWVAKS